MTWTLTSSSFALSGGVGGCEILLTDAQSAGITGIGLPGVSAPLTLGPFTDNPASGEEATLYVYDRSDDDGSGLSQMFLAFTLNSLTIQSVTPQTLLSGLAADVVALNLRKGIANSLDAKLDRALAALDDHNENDDVAACNALDAFINECQAQSGIQIDDPAEAANLIQKAQAVKAALGCQ